MIVHRLAQIVPFLTPWIDTLANNQQAVNICTAMVAAYDLVPNLHEIGQLEVFENYVNVCAGLLADIIEKQNAN